MYVGSIYAPFPPFSRFEEHTAQKYSNDINARQ